jgi:DNA topoisomerase I
MICTTFGRAIGEVNEHSAPKDRPRDDGRCALRSWNSCAGAALSLVVPPEPGSGAMQHQETAATAAPIELDPVRTARAAGLCYVSDAMPGITRRRVGKAFSYRGPDGRAIKDRADLARMRSLAIPPAWTDVWICCDANGHIQAIGRDARGRKQYRYHPEWRAVRDAAKFDRMLAFARALPRLRARVAQDQARRGLPREKVLATVVRLLEVTLIRIGNQEYARENKSYGLTTLRDRHVEFAGSKLIFEYRGKAGKLHRISLRDHRLARIVRSCQELPGQHLFQYIDEDGERQAVDSADVNEYLQEITGEPFTAKDFRTWAGTVLASLALSEFESFDSQAAAKRNITRAIEQVAAQLGNTVAVCRKSYIHPGVVEAYLDGTLLEVLRGQVEHVLREDLPDLSSEEAAVYVLLRQRLARELGSRSIKRDAALSGDELKAALRRSVDEERAPRVPGRAQALVPAPAINSE